MGLAKHHADDTNFRGATTTKQGTPLYEAPETKTNSKEPRSRQYDIWSMGCVFLELIVWLLYGYKELEKFNNCLCDSNASSPYWSLENKNAKVHPSVEQCMEIISRDPECTGSTAIGDLLTIVRTRLLVVRLPPKNPPTLQRKAALTAASKANAGAAVPSSGSRAKAEDLLNALIDMQKKGKPNESYWFTGASRDGLVGPVDSITPINRVFGSSPAGGPPAGLSPGGHVAHGARQEVSQSPSERLPADNLEHVAADPVGFSATLISRPRFSGWLHPYHGFI